jgi:hypothetical protein
VIDVDYRALEDDVISGVFRQRLEDELIAGFRTIHESGERLPLASYYASQIAEIINRASPLPLNAEFAFNLYQEILLAVEGARAVVLEEG